MFVLVVCSSMAYVRLCLSMLLVVLDAPFSLCIDAPGCDRYLYIPVVLSSFIIHVRLPSFIDLSDLVVPDRLLDCVLVASWLLLCSPILTRNLHSLALLSRCLVLCSPPHSLRAAPVVCCSPFLDLVHAHCVPSASSAAAVAVACRLCLAHAVVLFYFCLNSLLFDL